MKNKISIIIGTGRTDRFSDKVALFIKTVLECTNNKFRINVIDVRDYPSYFTVPSWQTDKTTKRLSDEIKSSDALYFIVPEYNHGYPGELKILLDRLSEEYKNKPAIICGVSSGSFGGSRAVENILPVLVYLGLIILSPVLYFSEIEKYLDNKDDIIEKKYKNRVQKSFNSISKFLTKYSN